MKESTIQSEILEYLNNLPNCKAINNHTGGFDRTGEPDIYACLSGQFIALEVKKPGENPTKIQEKRLREWEDAKGVAGVVTSIQDVRIILDIFNHNKGE